MPKGLGRLIDAYSHDLFEDAGDENIKKGRVREAAERNTRHTAPKRSEFPARNCKTLSRSDQNPDPCASKMSTARCALKCTALTSEGPSKYAVSSCGFCLVSETHLCIQATPLPNSGPRSRVGLRLPHPVLHLCPRAAWPLTAPPPRKKRRDHTSCVGCWTTG